MITIVLTYRDRDLNIVKKCLQSLHQQTSKKFEVVFVNYGSSEPFYTELQTLIKDYQFVTVINCKTSGELWCKSKAINIALKQCNTSHIFVGDVDMIFHPEFIEKLEVFKSRNITTYFQVGFLSQVESQKTKVFKDYNINFKSSQGATGMTLFKTDDLLEINGYDEFYKGWGSEDTDVHIRLKNANKEVFFYDEDILMLHQWHPKHYRSRDSTAPFHSHLEQINHEYLKLIETTKKVKANLGYKFGEYNETQYKNLKKPDITFSVTNVREMVKAIIGNLTTIKEQKVVKIVINEDVEYKSLKQSFKKALQKKTKHFLTMQEVNDMLLEMIVYNFKTNAYTYSYNQHTRKITLTLNIV